MRALVFALISSLALFSQHDKKAAKHSHGQKAHDHGAAEMNFAVEGKTIDIEFHVPAMAIVGFEYVPTSAADKKKQADALATLKANISKMVLFEPVTGCKITPKSVEIDQEEPDHAAVDGDFVANCVQPPGGTRVAFAVTKTYPGITTLKVQAVGSAGSNGAEIKSDKGALTLPR